MTPPRLTASGDAAGRSSAIAAPALIILCAATVSGAAWLASGADGWGATALDASFAVWTGWALAAVLRRSGGAPSPARLLGAGAALAGLAALAALPGARLTPWLGLVCANAGVCALFLRSLAPGRTPLILRIVDLMEGPEGDEAFRRFARGQCRLWAGFGALMSAFALAAMLSPSAREAAGMAMPALTLAAIAWFALSHEYAIRRHGRTETGLDTLRAMARPGAWPRLTLDR